MPRYWVGPWVWAADVDGVNRWVPPAGTLAALDLRSPAQCALAGDAQGNGLFVTANAGNLGTGYRNLGLDPQAVLTGPQKAAWKAEFALPDDLQATDLEGAVLETLTLQADPTGEDRVMPLVPNGRSLELWVAGQRVRRVAWDPQSVLGARTLLLLKRAYRRVRQDCLDGLLPAGHYRKVLGYWVRKYNLPYRLFQDNDLPDESDLPPTTTISETFDTADGTTLGPVLSWTEFGNDIDIHSNAFSADGTNLENRARADSILSSADQYSQVDATAIGTNTAGHVGPAARYAAGADTAYLLRYFGSTGTSVLRVAKCVAAVITDLGTGTSQSLSVPDTIKLQCNGTTLDAFFNGSSVESFTDTAIDGATVGGLYAGICCRRGAGANAFKGDNFTAADLAVAADAVPVCWASYRQRRV